MLIFHRSVQISLRPTKAEVQVLHPGHSVESHPKEKPVHRFNSRGHHTHGQGHNAYDICSDVFFQIRTREQESGVGTGFPPGTPVSPANLSINVPYSSLPTCLLIIGTKRAKRGNIQTKPNISGYQRECGG